MLRSQRFLLPAVLALAGLSEATAFANVLKVALTGAPYTQIQDAVNAASDGDVILIGNGTYNSFTISGKSLTVSALVTQGATILGTTTVTNLSASQRVVLSGLKGYGTSIQSAAPEAGVGLFVFSNAGSVRVESCNFYGALGWGDQTSFMCPACATMPLESSGKHAGFVRDNSGGVSFVACLLQAGNAGDAVGHPATIGSCICGVSQSGGDGLRIKSTLVSLYDCNVIGGMGGDNPSSGGEGGAGCRLVAATPITAVFSSGSQFRGGNGGYSTDYFCSLVGGRGGTALLVNPSTYAHLMDNLPIPGAGGGSYAAPPGQYGGGVTGGGSIYTDPEWRLLMTTDRMARAGSVVDLRVIGAPGQRIELLVSRAPTFQILPSWRGTLLSNPGKGSIEVPIGTIPANGVLQTRYVVPPLATGITAMDVFVQACRVDPVLGRKLAAGTTITLMP